MAVLPTKVPKFKPAKDVEINWDSWRGGLNTILKETEVADNELVQMDNLMLIGKGVPTNRMGTLNYFQSSPTGSVRGLFGMNLSDTTNQLLAITDHGLLTKKSGATYEIITGASWASGYNVFMTQLSDNVYICNGQRETVRYSNPTLYSFPTIAIPTGVFATQYSGVSGAFSPAYRVSAVSDTGETTASTSVQATNCPQDLVNGTVKVSWTGVSTASGVLKNYNIYGRNLGDERFLGSVPAGTTSFYDNGSAIPAEFTYPPLADSTGGIVAKVVFRFEDRLIYCGISGDPSKVIISGREPLQERTDLASGGNFVRIEPDAGDDIVTGGVFENRIIIFKEHSIWQITLDQVAVGNYTVTQPKLQLITASHGCIAPKSVVAVENDVFFLSRNGVYALGYEPNVFNVLRTNEISAKIRPFFDNLTVAQKEHATATYANFKYILSFPGKDKTMVYDRERLAWMGPWSFDSNIFATYYDSNNEEKILYGSDSTPYVIELSANYNDDNGVAIPTQLRTKKGDFKNWSIFKNIKHVFTALRNVQGNINVSIRLQSRDGQVTTAKSFSVETVSSNAGFGAYMFGNFQFGDGVSSGGATDVNEIYRWLTLNKASRSLQIIITTTNRNDHYELLAIKSIAKPLGFGFLPSSEKV